MITRYLIEAQEIPIFRRCFLIFSNGHLDLYKKLKVNWHFFGISNPLNQNKWGWIVWVYFLSISSMYLDEHDTYSHGLSQLGSFKQKQNQFVESHMVSLWSDIKLNNRFIPTDTTATVKICKPLFFTFKFYLLWGSLIFIFMFWVFFFYQKCCEIKECYLCALLNYQQMVITECPSRQKKKSQKSDYQLATHSCDTSNIWEFLTSCPSISSQFFKVAGRWKEGIFLKCLDWKAHEAK